MKYDKLEYYVSQPRLNRFLVACGYSKSKTQSLYQANVRVSQSFYPLLNLFEVFFRNACNYQVAEALANPNWILAEKDGFMNDPSLKRTKFFLKNSVIKAENSILKTKGAVTTYRIIAEQSFGFWTSLFEPHHYRLIKGAVIHAFPNKPEYINRSDIHQRLVRVREFRNRIYHNEPICFNHSSFDLSYAGEIKQELYDLSDWMNADIPAYIQALDTIDGEIYSANKMMIG